MNSIFGIGVLEFIFILIFALIFLGPERLPKVTREILGFIRRLQKLSGELTRQVSEEIGDLRELDPSYHMQQLMDEEEEDEKSAKGASRKSTAATRQTSAPSQPQTTQTIGAESTDSEEKTSAPETAATAAQPALSDLNASASTNGRQQSGESADGKSKTTGTAVPSAPSASSSKVTTRNPAVGSTPREKNNTQKRGVKTLADLRKQQRAKRQSSSSGSNSSYVEERNKRAQRRAEDRRQALAAQKAAEEEAPVPKDAKTDQVDAPAGDESAALGNDRDGSTGVVADSELNVQESGVDSDEQPIVAVTEAQEESGDDGSEETQA